MTKEKFLKRYEKHDKDVREYMEMFADSLVEKYGDIPEIYIVSLDTLAGNLTVMSKAMKDIVDEKVGIVGKDEYRGEKKSTQLQAFMASQHNVQNIIQEFGWTPKSKSKIRENIENDDVKKFLSDLTK